MKPFGPPSTNVRSPQYVPRGAVLTDEQIYQYALKGFYGAARQASARIEESIRKAEKRKARPETRSPALDILGL